MAIYHFSVKTISRSAGRTATAAAAYRSATDITDERTGEVHTYRHKKGVVESGVILPPAAPRWAVERPALWNAAEAAEKRKNSTVAREIVVALPAEIDGQGRARIVREFAEKLAEKHRCAVDYAIHQPNTKGDDRNYHAHILMSTRRLTADGFTEKTREWDDRKSGTVEHWRAAWAEHLNRHMKQSGLAERVSHLSLAEQGIDDREPTRHKGVAATAIERRNRAAIEADTTLRATAKSRALRTRQPQKTAQPEPADGHRFGQPVEQTPLQREAARLEAELAALKAEREQERQREAADRQKKEAAAQPKAESPKTPQQQLLEAARESGNPELLRMAQIAIAVEYLNRRMAQMAGQQKQAEREPMAAEREEQTRREQYQAMPTAELVRAYQDADNLHRDGKRQTETVAAGHWFADKRTKIQEADESIGQLEYLQRVARDEFQREQQRRESRLFGLGAAIAKIQGDNAKQHRLLQEQVRRAQEIERRSEERRQHKVEYDRRLHQETGDFARRLRTKVERMADEIIRRPEQEFTEPFKQAAAQIRTSAGRNAVEQVEREAKKHRSMGNKADERISYYTGTATVQKAEQLAQRQQERRQQREQDDGRGYSR